MKFDKLFPVDLKPNEFNSVMLNLLVGLKIDVEINNSMLLKIIAEATDDPEKLREELKLEREKFTKERAAEIAAEIIKDYWTPPEPGNE